MVGDACKTLIPRYHSSGKFMIRRIALLAIVLSISGCATYAPSIPANYTGPTAKLEDSATTYSSTKADFFVVESIDDAKVDNSLNETFRRNNGRGMSMTPYFIDRPLIAEKTVKIGVKGRTHFAAPILALAGTVYQVQGIVEFTPKTNGLYIVRGEFAEDHSAVWIEDQATKQLVSQRVEVKGSAKLGFFEK
jgi:hypothetical protein